MHPRSYPPKAGAHAVLLVGMACAPALAQDPAAAPVRPSGIAAPDARQEPAPAFPEMTSEQAWAAFRSGVRFLDARLREDYGQGHIPGALNLAVWEKDFEDRWTDFLVVDPWDRKVRVVVYCKGCCSTDSLLLANRLGQVGFTHIQIYRDGYPGWLRAGHPKVLGPTPTASEVPR